MFTKRVDIGSGFHTSEINTSDTAATHLYHGNAAAMGMSSIPNTTTPRKENMLGYTVCKGLFFC